MIIRQLRPAQLEDRGLADTLRQTIRSWCNQTQIPVQVNITGERRIPLEREQALLRVAQEALSNVARHSGGDHGLVWFGLRPPHELTMTISDNGVGFGRKPRGWYGLAEYAGKNRKPGWLVWHLQRAWSGHAGCGEVATDWTWLAGFVRP